MCGWTWHPRWQSEQKTSTVTFLPQTFMGKTAPLQSPCPQKLAKPTSLFSWIQQPFFPIQLCLILRASTVLWLVHQSVPNLSFSVVVSVFSSLFHCPSKSAPGAVQKAPLCTLSSRTMLWGLYFQSNRTARQSLMEAGPDASCEAAGI